MQKREFAAVGERQIDCTKDCGETYKEWSDKLRLLGVLANGQDAEQFVVWCNAPGALKQDNKKIPRLCVKSHSEGEITEIE